MATVKHSPSNKVNRLINYCEKRAEITSSHNLVAEDRKSVQKQMEMTRELFNKTDGVQGHHFIHSFKPGEVTPEQANEIGLKLVQQMHPDREAVVYTHTDKGHIHNHIVLNSLSIEDGKKLSVTKKHYYDWQRQNDAICKEYGLSIIKEKEKKLNKTQAEYAIDERGGSFKSYLRETIDRAKEVALNFKEMQNYLKEKWFVESKQERGLYYFKTPEMNRFVSGKTLGNDYSKEVLERGFRSNERTYEERQREQRERDQREQAERTKKQRELEQSRGANEQLRKNVGMVEDGSKRAEPANGRSQSRQQEPSRATDIGQQKPPRTIDQSSRKDKRALQKDLNGISESKSSGGNDQQGQKPIIGRSIDADRSDRKRQTREKDRGGGLEL